MVSSSRKKNKGKDRKAKKIEAERSRKEKARFKWLSWAIGNEKVTGSKTIECDHGCDDLLVPNDIDHPVVTFLNNFIIHLEGHNTTFTYDYNYTIAEMLQATFKVHPQVWNDESYKNMAVDIMTSMGTNMLLAKGDTGVKTKMALNIARSIIILENYNGTGSYEAVSNSRVVQSKARDLHTCVISSKRDALKFFSKRVPCSCLKKMHQEERRTIPKTGKCAGCNKEMERVALSVCSRCMIMQYCSRSCQVSAWPRHKEDCDILANTHKERISANRRYFVPVEDWFEQCDGCKLVWRKDRQNVFRCVCCKKTVCIKCSPYDESYMRGCPIDDFACERCDDMLCHR